MKLAAFPATEADVDELVLRAEDAREVSEGWRELVKVVVARGGVEAFRDPAGALAGLGGITRPDLVTLSPWMLCSDVANRHARDVLRLSRWMVRKRLAPFVREGGFVFNHVPKDSYGNRRFLQSLGFRIVPSPDGRWDLFYLPPHV
jgi:hypothetical protein